MIRNQYTGLGDLYPPATSIEQKTLQGAESTGRFTAFAFGMAPLSQSRQEYWRDRIKELYNGLANRGLIDPAEAWNALTAADFGVLLVPAASNLALDRTAQAAVVKINQAAGLSDLRRALLAEMKQALREEGAGLEAEVAELDALYTGMYYISGAVALDKLNGKWNEITASVSQAQEMLAQARSELDDEGCQKVLAELSPINAQVARLQSYFGTQDAGQVGAVQLILVAIVGVALAVAVVAAALIVKMLTRARNLYAEEAARMLKLKQDNAQGDYDLTASGIQTEFADGTIGAEERDSRLAAAQADRDQALSTARRDYETQQKNLPSSGVGGLSLGLGAVALAGLGAVLLLRK